MFGLSLPKNLHDLQYTILPEFARFAVLGVRQNCSQSAAAAGRSRPTRKLPKRLRAESANLATLQEMVVSQNRGTPI